MGMQPMPSNPKIIGELHKALRKRNGKCLCPGSTCSKKPIHSHVVSEKILRLIAENSCVHTWDLPFDMLIKRLQAGLRLEHLYFEPTLVGVGQKSLVTCPLFCEDHDGSIFASVEQSSLSSQLDPEHIALIAYRTLCAATYDQKAPERAFAVGKKYGERTTLDTPEKLPKLNRFLARDELLLARFQYEQILKTQDYRRVEYTTFLVNMPPCIACTDTVIPSDPLDAMMLVTGSHTLTAEDVVVYSLFPYPPMHSLFVISWLRGSQRARVFLDYNINPVPDEEKPDFFLSMGFQARNVYISPTWWKALSQEQRMDYIKVHLEAGREFAAYV